MQKIRFKEQIYTYHIDFVGHVNNIVYIQWMENGRLHLLNEIGFPVSDLAKKEGVVPVIIETKITYKNPLFINNHVEIEVWISKLNNASAILEFRFYNENGKLCASGQQKGLFIDRKSMRPARLTTAHREAFEKLLAED